MNVNITLTVRLKINLVLTAVLPETLVVNVRVVNQIRIVMSLQKVAQMVVLEKTLVVNVLNVKAAQEVVTQPSPAEQPDVVTAVLSEENTGLLHRHQPQKNAVAAAQPNLSLLSQDMPAVRYIMTDICPATMRSVRLHAPAEPLTSGAAAVAKQQKPLCFQRGFSFAQGSKI